MGRIKATLIACPCYCLALLDSALLPGGSSGARERDRQPLDWTRRGYKRSFVHSFLQRIAYGLPVVVEAILTAYGLHVAWVVAQTELPRGCGLPDSLGRSLLGERQRHRT